MKNLLHNLSQSTFENNNHQFRIEEHRRQVASTSGLKSISSKNSGVNILIKAK